MSYTHITLELGDDAVATITLNRPDSLNALNAGMIEELTEALATLPARAVCC